MALRYPFLLLFLSLHVLAAQSKTPTYPNAFGEYKVGNYEKALKEVDGLLVKNPADAQALELRGRILHGLGRFDDAREEFFKALKIDPKRVNCHYYLGEIAFAQGYWPEAIEFYNVHLSKGGQQLKARLKLIYCQVATDNISEAAKQIPFLDPGDDLFPGYYFGQTAIYLAEEKKNPAESKNLKQKANDLMHQARTLYGNQMANTYEVEMLRIFKKSESLTLPAADSKSKAQAKTPPVEKK